MLKRFAAALAAGWLCLCLSGCSFTGLDPKNLMSPPKANADQQSIHKLLQGGRPDITFIYPKSGEYRAAIIMQDFTGDGVKDAIGFYTPDDSKSVEVQFLVKDGGEWKTAAVFPNAATQVDRVCFGDLTGDGRQDVLIGWGSSIGTTGRTASVNAYLYSDGDVRETPLGTYGEMAVTDFDGDGISEVFTIDKFVAPEKEDAQPSPARAKVYEFQNGELRESAAADADNAISHYAAVSFGRLTATLQGVVVDGAKADGSMTTQVFFLENGRLASVPAGVNGENYTNPFSRPSAATFTSRDIDSDGYLELPVVTPLPGIPDTVTPDATSYLVEWCTFERDGNTHTVMKTLMNPPENYWFRLPYELWGKLSASNDSAKRTVTYTETVPSGEDGEQLLGSPLFSIRVFTQSAWESRGQTSGYTQLAAQSDLVYGIQVLTKDETYGRAIEKVKENFRLISE